MPAVGPKGIDAVYEYLVPPSIDRQVREVGILGGIGMIVSSATFASDPVEFDRGIESSDNGCSMFLGTSLQHCRSDGGNHKQLERRRQCIRLSSCMDWIGWYCCWIDFAQGHSYEQRQIDPTAHMILVIKCS